MRTKRALFPILLSLAVFSMFIPVPEVLAQHSDTVALGITPALFSAGQPASVILCVSSTAVATGTLQPGDKFTFTMAAALGTVTTFATPPYVSSSTLAAGDFSVALGTNNNQVVVTYNGATRAFAFGDSVCVRRSAE